MKKYYTESELKGLNLKEDQLMMMANEKLNFHPKLKQLRQFVPEASVYYKISDYDGVKTFESSRIGFVRNGVMIFARTSVKKKKDYFYIDNDQFINVSRVEIGDFYDEPNLIGVYTQKKVDDWINYLVNVHNKATELDRERAQKVEDFFSEIEKIGGCKGKKGVVEKNGLLLTWIIDYGQIYLSIKLSNVGKPTLELFKALADNKYKVK